MELKSWALGLAFGCAAMCASANAGVEEIARGHSWVSPYWGYSSPKIAFDGKAYYTCGLWGDTPEKAEAVVYKHENGKWRAGASLPGLYQPAIVLLDSQRRPIVVYNRQNAPIAVLRGRAPGDIDSFDALPAPPEHATGYYLGAAIRGDTLQLAWLVTPDYTLYRATLDLATSTWSTPAMVQQGQSATLPKTAWTYPILWPDDKGLHLVASNAPDGGEGNTYNEVWYLFFPNGANEPAIRERVARCPVGHFAFAMDLRVDDAGPHVLLMYNVRKYGDPLPADAEPEGTYCARRDAATSAWRMERAGPASVAGYWDGDGPETVVLQEAGAIAIRARNAETGEWTTQRSLCPSEGAPAWPSFMDVLNRASGSRTEGGCAVVVDGLLPGDPPQTRILWSILPSH